MADESRRIEEDVQSYRRRPSARWLVLNPARELLLFHFEHREGPLSGQAFWATPGGGLKPDETFEQAAARELREETGIVVPHAGSAIAERLFHMTLPDGEKVLAEERFFSLRLPQTIAPQRDQWTALEQRVMTRHRWWSAEALASTQEVIAPANLGDMLRSAGLW